MFNVTISLSTCHYWRAMSPFRIYPTWPHYYHQSVSAGPSHWNAELAGLHQIRLFQKIPNSPTHGGNFCCPERGRGESCRECLKFVQDVSTGGVLLIFLEGGEQIFSGTTQFGQSLCLSLVFHFRHVTILGQCLW